MCLQGKAHFCLVQPVRRRQGWDKGLAETGITLTLSTFGMLNCPAIELLQRPLDVGPTLESFRLSLLCTFLACPAAQLLSLLFRFSKVCGPGLLGRPLMWGALTNLPLYFTGSCRASSGCTTVASKGSEDRGTSGYGELKSEASLAAGPRGPVS